MKILNKILEEIGSHPIFLVFLTSWGFYLLFDLSFRQFEGLICLLMGVLLFLLKLKSYFKGLNDH